MDLGEDLGTVEEGKLADLIVVDGDPVQDITCLEDADHVLAGTPRAQDPAHRVVRTGTGGAPDLARALTRCDR